MENKEFDDILKSKFHELEGPDIEQVWKGVLPTLSKPQGRKRWVFWFFILAISLTGVIGVQSYMTEAPIVESVKPTEYPENLRDSKTVEPKQSFSPENMVTSISPPSQLIPVPPSVPDQLFTLSNLPSEEIQSSMDLPINADYMLEPNSEIVDQLGGQTYLIPIEKTPRLSFPFLQRINQMLIIKNNIESPTVKPLKKKNSIEPIISFEAQQTIQTPKLQTTFGDLDVQNQQKEYSLGLGFMLRNGFIMMSGVGYKTQQIQFTQKWSELISYDKIRVDTFLMVDLRQRKIVFNVQTKRTTILDSTNNTMSGQLRFQWITLPLSFTKELGKGYFRTYPSIQTNLYIPILASGILNEKSQSPVSMNKDLMSPLYLSIRASLGLGLLLNQRTRILLTPSYQWAPGVQSLCKNLLKQKSQGFSVGIQCIYSIRKSY